MDPAVAERLRRSCAWMRGPGGGAWSSFDFVDTLEVDVEAWLASGWIERMSLPHADVEAIALTAAAFEGIPSDAAGADMLCLGLGGEHGHLAIAFGAAACAGLRLPTSPLGPDREPTVALWGVTLPPEAFLEPVGSLGWQRRTLSVVGGAMSSVVRPQALLIDVDTASFEAEVALDLMDRGLPLWRGPIGVLSEALAHVGGGAR